MAVSGDRVFFAGWGSVFIIMGLVILLYAMEFIGGSMAFGVWLLFTSLILVGLGSIRTDSSPRGSGVLVVFGLIFTVIAVALLGIMEGVLTPLMAFAMLILLAGVGVVVMGLRRG